MSTCRLIPSSGQPIRVSVEAANLALAFDQITRFPEMAQVIKPGIDSILLSASLLTQVEKSAGPEALRELVSKYAKGLK
jgi:hypothetical protein